MIVDKEVREYLIDFQKKNLPELIKRNLLVSDNTQKIITIIGPRRAGKTYYLFQLIKKLLDEGIKKENIVYLNFEDPRLFSITFKEIREIIKLHWQLYSSSIKEQLYLFIDEPQNVKNWEIAVRSLYDEGFRIFLSGSSSKLLSKEIASSLRGRTFSYLLLPFSFEEFLRMKVEKIDLKRISSKEKSYLLNLFEEYLSFGGFPEVILNKNKENKIKIISEYFNLIVFRDIVERFNIKNTTIIRWLTKTSINSFSKEFSVHKIYLTLKSQGIKVSKNTLYNYVSMLEDSFFVFSLPKFSYPIRKKEISINKIYLSDLGFTKLIELTEEKGKKFENIVFLELLRKKDQLYIVSYWKNILKEEVDFVIHKGGKVNKLIQVCYDISDMDTKKREIRALIKASKELKCNNLIVITQDKDTEEKVGSKKVRYLPLWSFLLDKNVKNP